MHVHSLELAPLYCKDYQFGDDSVIGASVCVNRDVYHGSLVKGGGSMTSLVPKRMLGGSTRPTVCLIVTAEITALTFYRGFLAYLVSMGWNVVLIGSSSGALETFAESQGATAIPIEMRREPSPLQDLLSLVRMLRVLAVLKPHVVMTATPKASLIGNLAAYLCRVPVRVYQLWGLRMETESGRRRRLLARLESLTARLSTQVVANSTSLASRAHELHVDGGKVVTVLGRGSSHGVNVNHFSREAVMGDVEPHTSIFLAATRGQFKVGFIGRLHPDKGISTLLEAARLCRSRGVNISILIVGPIESESVAAEIRGATAELRIQVVGPVTDTRPYLRSMDVLCLPTLREGFPNVVLEAAAMGLPTIASDATGSVDSVVDGVTGLLFPVRDSAALAAALELLALDDAYRSRLGFQARHHVQKFFATEKIWPLLESNLKTQLKVAEER